MREMKKVASLLGVAALAAAALWAATAALTPDSAASSTGTTAVTSVTKTPADGVFTAEQADAGQAVYDNSCKNCHDKRFYRDALRNWNGQPLLYLWESVLSSMPADNPGSLALDDYTNVLAYILSEQGFPPGDTPLDPDSNMEDINITPP